jgi:hypothetical protein
VGNLTNAFAQSLAVIAFAMMAGPRSREGLRDVVLLAVVLAGAFLSHTSTFAIVSVAAALIAALCVRSASPGLRRAGIGIGIAAALAGTVAVALYYAHFVDTYRTEWARISTETAAAAPGAGGRTISQRVLDVPRNLHLYLGAPVLALAAGGAWILGRHRDRLRLATAGWALACVAFLALGLVTPVDMRHYLAIIPALAIAAATGADAGWTAGGWQRLAAAGLVAWAGLVAFDTWWSTLPAAG